MKGRLVSPMPEPASLYRLLGVCAVAASRFAFRSHLLYDADSVNFALAASAQRRISPTPRLLPVPAFGAPSESLDPRCQCRRGGQSAWPGAAARQFGE